MSVGGSAVTFSLWQESSSISITIPTLEVVDLCKPGSQFSRILSPKVRVLTVPVALIFGNFLCFGAMGLRFGVFTAIVQISLTLNQDSRFQEKVT